MKAMKRKLALLLAVLLMVPTMPANAAQAVAGEEKETVKDTVGVSGNVADRKAAAEEAEPVKTAVSDPVIYNTGSCEMSVVDASVSANVVNDGWFGEDGSYTIEIPELNPFFPYEVQFTYHGKVTNQWFMTPDDSVEIGGHTFYVSAQFDGKAVTQMSLNVAGDIVTVYPEEKEFTNDGKKASDGEEPALMSLLPLKEKRLRVDLRGYTPAELTMVSAASIFTGENALTDTDKVVWQYKYDEDNYTISTSGDQLDLSYRTYMGDATWEMIVGAANQLAADNTRYLVTINTTASSDWLVPVIYTQDNAGKRVLHNYSESSYDDYYTDKTLRNWYIYMPSVKDAGNVSVYLGLEINPSVFPTAKFDSFKVYEGRHATAEEAAKGADITSKICCQDMAKQDAGYKLDRDEKNRVYPWVTIVTFGADNQVTGCLPIRINWYMMDNWVQHDSFFEKTEHGRNYICSTYTSTSRGGCRYETATLYKEYAADGQYSLTLDYCKAGVSSNSDVTAAYAGQYASIKEAQAAGAADIKNVLMPDNYSEGGYTADYSKGVYFTIFIGEDGSNEQEVYKYCMTSVQGKKSKDEITLSNGTYVYFTGLKNSAGGEIPSYETSYDDDSYGEYNYMTIITGADTDLTCLAPVFTTSTGVKLYAAGSSSPEVSGVSCHDFSKGPVQYTASAENGTGSKNYWLQVVKASEGKGRLYINSLEDPASNTRVENGIIYSTREVMLDGYHDYVHDIWFANMGTESIEKLSARLDSDVAVLDDYWTFNGEHALSGFGGTEKTTSYGELSNLAKLRIRLKDENMKGTDLSGTLTIKSGEITLMVLTLTGIVGDPAITTKEIPQAVKYVPYGTMIQNNNKYSWNTTSYKLTDGTLPEGMEVKPNGELYGVPCEAGEFTFTVKMTNSSSSFAASEMTYTLTVAENTDVNVDGATDSGYELRERVQEVKISDTRDQTLVSEGEYSQFVAIYLDGQKLVAGTDYTSEKGSTRITIKGQTLGARETGTHTLGVEFRTEDTDTLKRAAQNYVVNEGGSDDNGNNNGNNGDNNGNDNGNNNGGNGGNDNGSTMEGATGSGSLNQTGSRVGSAVNAAVGAADTTVSYTIQSGDTLWRIAEKYYGSGSYWKKIYEDNKDLIPNPDKIYAGQVIVIHLGQERVTAAAKGNTYTVQSGDNLYKIAEKFYGKGRRWKKIYQANQNILSKPEQIYAGQILVIPE